VRDIVSFFNSHFLWFNVDLYSTAAAVMMLILPFCLMTAGSIVIWLGPYLFKVKIKSDKIPKAFSGYKIVQLSDIHIGHMVGLRLLKKITSRVNKLNPDLIVMTGDIIDGDPELYGDLSIGLESLRAKDGILYVTG